MPVAQPVRSGVASTAQLLRLGWTDRTIAAAVAEGTLTRLRPGWLARADADARVVAAVRSGGCLSCADALRAHGAWVPESVGRGHVRRTRRTRTDRRTGCRHFGRDRPIASAVDDLETAFRCLLRCGTLEDVVVVADSLLHLRLATSDEVEAWVTDAPLRIRGTISRVDVAESGLESMVRLRLRARNVLVRTQVWIGGARVDLLVGERLVIECDGAEHHASWDAQSADRARDLRLTTLGYVVVRLTYRQIVDGWPAVEAELMTLIRAETHRTTEEMCT